MRLRSSDRNEASENKLENDRYIYFLYLVVAHRQCLLSFINIAIVVCSSTSQLGVACSSSSMIIGIGLSQWLSFSSLWIFGTHWFRPSSCICCCSLSSLAAAAGGKVAAVVAVAVVIRYFIHFVSRFAWKLRIGIRFQLGVRPKNILNLFDRVIKIKSFPLLQPQVLYYMVFGFLAARGLYSTLPPVFSK